MNDRFPKLDFPAVLSPMAGVTDVAFRALAKKHGAGMTTTEFVSGTALVRENWRAWQMVATDPIEKPVAVQLFGNSFDDVVEAAKQVEDRFDVIDINCGCPAWKVIKTGAGSEMLKKPEGISTLINRLVSAVNKPVTLKIRSGIDQEQINAVEVAKTAEDAGAAAIAIHGRTQKQGYRGEADWEIIKKVKEKVNIPVIGNGDVFDPETFKKRLDESGVDAIMIARGAVGDPHIFTRIRDYLKKGNYDQPDKLELFKEYLELAEKHQINFATIKAQCVQFTKGLQGGASLRRQLNQMDNPQQLLEALENFSENNDTNPSV